MQGEQEHDLSAIDLLTSEDCQERLIEAVSEDDLGGVLRWIGLLEQKGSVGLVGQVRTYSLLASQSDQTRARTAQRVSSPRGAGRAVEGRGERVGGRLSCVVMLLTLLIALADAESGQVPLVAACSKDFNRTRELIIRVLGAKGATLPKSSGPDWELVRGWAIEVVESVPEPGSAEGAFFSLLRHPPLAMGLRREVHWEAEDAVKL
jgi:hypothetical protein